MTGHSCTEKINMMKTTCTIIAMIFALMDLVFGQDAVHNDSTIKSYTIQITYNKTSTIVFPSSIISVDRGSGDVIVQRVKEAKNVLQLKANRIGFEETNLSIITNDGVLRHFLVRYLKTPSVLTFDLSNEITKNRRILFNSSLTDLDIERLEDQISKDKRRIRFTKDRRGDVSIDLLGIYVKSDVMFYRLRLQNRSHIDYNVEITKLYVQDKSRVKRTASQEIEIVPISFSKPIDRIPGTQTDEVIIAISNQTIPKSKLMNLELFERNGSRHLKLAINSKAIVNARLLD